MVINMSYRTLRILLWRTQLLKNKQVKSLHTACNRNARIKWSYAMPDNSLPLVGWTVGQVMENSAEKFGDEELLLSCHQNISKTYSEINKETTEFAAGLLSLGFKPGDRIGIWGPNSYEWCVTMFSAAKAGLLLVNINPAYRPAELKYCLNKVGITGLVCSTQFKSSNYYKMISEVAPEILSTNPSSEMSCKEMPFLKYIISMGDTQLNGAFNFKNIFDAGGVDDKILVEDLKTKIQFDDPCNMQFTSGTTGNPKAVSLSHCNIVNNAYFIGARNGFAKNKERVGINAPMFHCFGSVVGILTNVIYGCTTILPNASADPIAMLKAIKENGVTSCYGTPTMFVDILNEYRKNPFEIKNLHTGMMGGAPCPKELVAAVMTELKMKDFVIAFGMTETSPATFMCFPKDPPELRVTHVGYPLDQVEAKVVDENGRIVPVGVPGELYIRGYCVFLEYWGDEEKTKETIQKDRWLKTGDLVVMEETKYLKIIGRITDVIIRGGENIYPTEIENFFLGHHSIIEAHVFGVPDQRMGEEIGMWFKSSDKNLSEDDLKTWAKDKISHFKIPRYILQRDEFPTNYSGKIQKFVMKEKTMKLMGLDE